MSFTSKHNTHKQYSISLKSPNGNTVGFINLSSQFLKAVIGKQEETITASDILSINHEDFQGYIESLVVEVSETIGAQTPIKAEDY